MSEASPEQTELENPGRLRDDPCFKCVIFLAITALGLGLIGGWLLPWAITNLRSEGISSPAITLTVLLVFGLGVLLFVLATMVGVFYVFKLNNPTEALGLPEGSVRAIVALSLLVIFSIMALFLFSRLESGVITYEYANISQDQLDAIPSDQVVSIQVKKTDKQGKVYDVKRRIPRNPASDDFAKQVLTIVANLLFAIVGFYFGTRAALQVPGQQEAKQKTTNSPSP